MSRHWHITPFNRFEPHTSAKFPLHKACDEGDFAKVKQLISRGEDVNGKDKSLRSPLQCALFAMEVSEKDEKVVKIELDGENSNCNITVVKYSPKTEENNNIIKLLIDHNADFAALDRKGRLASHYYARIGNVEMIQFLIDRNIPFNLGDNNGVTPLHFAAQSGSLESVQLILDRGVDLTCEDSFGMTPIHYASISGNVEMVKIFMEKGFKLHQRDKKDWTPLHYAVVGGHTALIDFILNCNTNVNCIDSEHKTLLHLSLQYKKNNVTKLLLDSGVDIKATDSKGWTALHFAVNSPKMVELILNGNVLVDAKTKEGETPLHMAVRNGKLDCVELLLSHSADANAQSNNGQTPLHKCLRLCSFRDSVAVPTLIDHGADVSIPDESGKTPLDLVIRISRVCQTRELILKQSTRLRAAEMAFTDRTVESLVFDSDPNFHYRCEQEIKLMKLKNYVHDVSFYRILFEPLHKLVAYCKYTQVNEMISCGSFKEEFPIYARMLEIRLNKAFERRNSLQIGEDFLSSLSHPIPKLPFDCIEIILSFLSNKDLKTLTKCYP